MPLGLIRYTCPFALRLPRIWLPLPPSTRFTAIALAEGCTKLTVSPLPMLKLFQFRERFLLACVTVVTAPDWLMALLPTVTTPPEGAASADSTIVVIKSAALSFHPLFTLAVPALVPFLRVRAPSATGTKELVAVLLMSR